MLNHVFFGCELFFALCKLHQLSTIVKGLNSIHEQKLIHRDLHSGNILNKPNEFINNVECYIADLGLCRPASEENREKIYGVLPYIAPEILKNKEYTPKSDVYSFGIVAYEVFSELPPYHDLTHDEHLASKICQGLRPSLNKIKMPVLLKSLIIRCLDTDPLERPTANELKEILNDWCSDIKDEDTEFYRQYKEVEEFNKVLPESINKPAYKIHPSAVYTSRLLDFKNLPQLQSSLKINYIDDEIEIDKASAGLTTRIKRKLSLYSQTRVSQEKAKLFKTNERKCYSKSVEIDYSDN